MTTEDNNTPFQLSGLGNTSLDGDSQQSSSESGSDKSKFANGSDSDDNAKDREEPEVQPEQQVALPGAGSTAPQVSLQIPDKAIDSTKKGQPQRASGSGGDGKPAAILKDKESSTEIAPSVTKEVMNNNV
jgi:hypothetical protein